LKLSGEKCVFCRKEVKYLGYYVSSKGIRISEDKLEIIRNYPRPNSQTKLKSYLGFVNFFKKLIVGYSHVTIAFQNLLQKNAPFIWTDDHDRAFNELKLRLLSAPILKFVDLSKPIHVTTDCSSFALGWVITQPHDNTVKAAPHLIAAGGRYLNKTEQRRSVADLEALAILEACKHNHSLLTSCKFHVYTDHCSLQYIKSFANHSGRLYRYSLGLQNYDYEIHYKKGSENIADFLSRIDFNDQLGTKQNNSVNDDIIFDNNLPLPKY
jgi:hypothetical protein